IFKYRSSPNQEIKSDILFIELIKGYIGNKTAKIILLSSTAFPNFNPLRTLYINKNNDIVTAEYNSQVNSFCLFTSYTISNIFQLSFSEKDGVIISFSIPMILNDFSAI